MLCAFGPALALCCATRPASAPRAIAEEAKVAALLGVVFALSFCPISAFLFFTSLLTLAAKTGSTFLVPALFGVGTALPVVAFSVVIALSAKAVGGAFKRVSQFEWWARRATGVIFILVGIYYSLVYVWGVTW